MPEISISKAIKMAGISRQHFYDAYINTGKITVNRSIPKRPVIDTSEILRVFGRLSEDRQQEDNKKMPIVFKIDEATNTEIERLRAENFGLRSLVEEKNTRILEKDLEIERQRERISSLEIRYDRLLEGKESKIKTNSSYWQKIKSIFS